MDRFVVGAQPKDESLTVTIDLKPIVTASKSGSAERVDYYRQLIARAYALQADVEAAIAQIRADDLEFLLPQHETAKTVAREAKREFETAFNQRLRYMNAELDASSESQKCKNHLSALRNNPPNPNNYPTQNELTAYQQSIVDAEDALNKAKKAAGEAKRESAVFFADLNSLESKFNDAANKELALRQKIEALQNKPTPSIQGLSSVVLDSRTGLGGEWGA